MRLVIGSKGGDVLAPRPTDQGLLRYGAPDRGLRETTQI